MQAIGIPAEGFSAEAMANTGFRIVDKGDKFWLEELYGGKKEYMVVLNEEYDYERPEWNMSDKRITTKVGPGSYKSVVKSNKIFQFLKRRPTVNVSTQLLKSHWKKI